MVDPNCIFCKIVQGLIPAARVYEDDLFLGFLDIAPVHPGHALLIPKAHYPTVLDMPENLGGPMLSAVQPLGQAVMAATGAGGFNLLVNTHRIAGQLVDHAHIHLIPRHADDGLTFWPQHAYASPDEMAMLAAKIRTLLA